MRGCKAGSNTAHTDLRAVMALLGYGLRLAFYADDGPPNAAWLRLLLEMGSSLLSAEISRSLVFCLVQLDTPTLRVGPEERKGLLGMESKHPFKIETRDAIGRTSLLRVQRAKPNNVEATGVAWRILLSGIKKESLSR